MVTFSQLAKVASVRVVGRTSVMGYEETAKPLRQIAEELVVGSIVQVVGDRLRVTVRLLDPVTKQHLWSGAVRPHAGRGDRGGAEAARGRTTSISKGLE